MGIPSYFSFIVKKHSKIIKKFNKNCLKVNNLYLDSNSIIYDAVHNIDFTKLVESDVKTIINCVINKIDEYIALIQPDTYIYIAFDGVAPVAKLEQQRERRYKSLYQAQISKSIFYLQFALKHYHNVIGFHPYPYIVLNLLVLCSKYIHHPFQIFS